MQVERGEVAGKLHLQASLKLREKKRPGQVAQLLTETFNLPAGACHCRPTASSEGSFKYCMKEDSRVLGPWADRPIYLGEDVAIVGSDPHPWQREVLRILRGNVNMRTVIWVTNTKGNVGKSAFTKFCHYKKIAFSLPMGAAHQLRSVVVAVGSKPAYILDITRSLGTADKVVDLITVIENIKNGLVQSVMYGKYEELLMAPAHVVVFANWSPPDLEALSADRWVLCEIDSGMNLINKAHPRPVTAAMGLPAAVAGFETPERGFRPPSPPPLRRDASMGENPDWGGGGAGAGAGGPIVGGAGGGWNPFRRNVASPSWE